MQRRNKVEFTSALSGGSSLGQKATDWKAGPEANASRLYKAVKPAKNKRCVSLVMNGPRALRPAASWPERWARTERLRITKREVVFRTRNIMF